MLHHDFLFKTFDVHLLNLPYLAMLYLFLVTRAAWERFEFLIKRVGDSHSFPFLSSVFNYALLVSHNVLNNARQWSINAGIYHNGEKLERWMEVKLTFKANSIKFNTQMNMINYF